jgi:hypothetical protein
MDFFYGFLFHEENKEILQYHLNFDKNQRPNKFNLDFINLQGFYQFSLS